MHFANAFFFFFFEKFCLFSHPSYWPIIFFSFSFFAVSLNGFCIMIMVASYNEFGNVLSSLVFELV